VRIYAMRVGTLLFLMLLFMPQALCAASCADLSRVRWRAVTILTAGEVLTGNFTPPGRTDSLKTPPFCRVVAVARPTSDSEINFEVWMPLDRQRYDLLGEGNGGYNGALPYSRMAYALRRGFAAAGTDTGHTGSDLNFGAGHPEKVVDWGHRAIHVMTEAAKRVVTEYSGRRPRHSFFEGCSTGGGQALSEAQRYPGDYDGIIAGDPGNNRVHLNVGFLWAFASTHDSDGNPILPSAKLPLVNQAAVAACDGLDGVVDGVISDPLSCHFDPATLLCRDGEADQCLTAEEVAAVRKVYQGPRNPRTGASIIAGYSPGSESPAGDVWAEGWKRYITDPKEPMRADFWRFWVFNDARWDWRKFDYDHDVAFADAKLAAVNATNTNLGAFKARGGKLLMYSGWADPTGPPMDAVQYYTDVVKRLGGRSNADGFFRLFMVPGMAHCDYGPGPNRFGNVGPRLVEGQGDPTHDILSALVRWVEEGTPPTRIVASRFTNDVLDRTRPLCPYPQTARWTGEGSSDDAAFFRCED
jgi:feruloyl esterase